MDLNDSRLVPEKISVITDRLSDRKTHIEEEPQILIQMRRECFSLAGEPIGREVLSTDAET